MPFSILSPCRDAILFFFARSYLLLYCCCISFGNSVTFYTYSFILLWLVLLKLAFLLWMRKSLFIGYPVKSLSLKGLDVIESLKLSVLKWIERIFSALLFVSPKPVTIMNNVFIKILLKFHQQQRMLLGICCLVSSLKINTWFSKSLVCFLSEVIIIFSSLGNDINMKWRFLILFRIYFLKWYKTTSSCFSLCSSNFNICQIFGGHISD